MFKFVKKSRLAQSTVELALLLPTIILMVSGIIYVYRINHADTKKTTDLFAEKMYKYHVENMVFDPEKGAYVPEGQYSELIPDDANINPADLAGKLGLELLAQLGLSSLFSKLNIFNQSTYASEFAKGFTYSLASSTASNLIEKGNLKDMSAKDLESATWAGAASALSSKQATEDFQGGSRELGTEGKVLGAQELFGSGAQGGLVSFAQSQGDWKAGVAGAAGGMINSDTSKNWVKVGADGKAETKGYQEMLRGAGMGAIQSSANGAIGGNLTVKTVLIGGAQGAIQTDAFAKTLPLTGGKGRDSAMYGAFNGAFSSVVSGGNLKSTLVATASGAIGSKQTSTAMGNSKLVNFGVNTAVNAGGGLLQGQSLKAVGQGALMSTASTGVSAALGWVGNQISPSLSRSFGSSNNVREIKEHLANQTDTHDIASDPVYNEGIGDSFDAMSEGIKNAQTIKSFEPKNNAEEIAAQNASTS